jgi:hypothetical protein
VRISPLVLPRNSLKIHFKGLSSFLYAAKRCLSSGDHSLYFTERRQFSSQSLRLGESNVMLCRNQSLEPTGTNGRGGAKMMLIWYEFTNYLNFEGLGVTGWYLVGGHQDHRVGAHQDHPTESCHTYMPYQSNCTGAEKIERILEYFCLDFKSLDAVCATATLSTRGFAPYPLR